MAWKGFGRTILEYKMGLCFDLIMCLCHHSYTVSSLEWEVAMYAPLDILWCLSQGFELSILNAYMRHFLSYMDPWFEFIITTVGAPIYWAPTISNTTLSASKTLIIFLNKTSDLHIKAYIRLPLSNSFANTLVSLLREDLVWLWKSFLWNRCSFKNQLPTWSCFVLSSAKIVWCPSGIKEEDRKALETRHKYIRCMIPFIWSWRTDKTRVRIVVAFGGKYWQARGTQQASGCRKGSISWPEWLLHRYICEQKITELYSWDL